MRALAELLMERKVHPSQVAQRRSDGSVEVRLEVALVPPLGAYLTGLGAAVSELEPAELRTAVLREHRNAVAGLGDPWKDGSFRSATVSGKRDLS
jgi:predicted DNA-binding transcriptional regulator YafY